MRLSISGNDLAGMDKAAIFAHGVGQCIFHEQGAARLHLAFARSCSGHGGIGLKKAACAYWHLCRGKSAADVMEAVGIGESTVVRLQRHMLGAVWLDALMLQSEN